MGKQQGQEEDFKVLYAKEGDTTSLYYVDCRDGQEFEKAATCDYIKLKSITYDLGGGPPGCEFELRYGGEVITRNFPPEDFLHDQNGRYTLTKKLAALGFYRGNVNEIELIVFVRQLYKQLRLDPYWTTDFRGWLTHNGKPLFVSDKIYGPYRSSPSMNPAYQPSPGASLAAFLWTVDKHVVGWPPSETALGLALGAVLLGHEQVDPLRAAAGSVSAGFSGAVGFVAPTALGKTANLEFASACFSNVFYGTTFNTATYGDTVLPSAHNANCTTNYLFRGIDKINGLFMQIDDLTGGVLNDTEHVLYQLSQGQEKGRATPTGLARRNRFCTLFGLTNERSLITPETNGGVYSRYLELRINGFCRNAAQAEALTEAARYHPATLGPAFVTRLITELQSKPTLVSDLAQKYRQRLHDELDNYELKDAQALRAQKRLAKLLCYIPSSLELFNLFFASGRDATCRPIDTDGYTEWLALRLSENDRDSALKYNLNLDITSLVDFIKLRFYFTAGGVNYNCRLGDKKDYKEIDFFGMSGFEVYDYSCKLVGYKTNNEVVILTGALTNAYNLHVQEHNRLHPQNKIGTTLIQYLKGLKLNGVLSYDPDRMTRQRLFDRMQDGTPIMRPCYVFRLDSTISEQDITDDYQPAVDTESVTAPDPDEVDPLGGDL